MNAEKLVPADDTLTVAECRISRDSTCATTA